MHPLEKYGIRQGDETVISSPLCSAAESMANYLLSGEVHNEIHSLIFAYYNQWRFVLVAYEKLHTLFSDLNTASDERKGIVITPYDVKSEELSQEFSNYSYLLVISMKTVLDSFACLVDIIQNQTPRKRYPDFNSYPRKVENPAQEIKNQFCRMRDEQPSNWTTKLFDLRNQVIHGGVLLRPVLGFQKVPILVMQPSKGNDYYSMEKIDIGELFDQFMTNVPVWEQKIADILVSEIEILPYGITQLSSFRFAGSFSMFEVKDTDLTQ